MLVGNKVTKVGEIKLCWDARKQQYRKRIWKRRFWLGPDPDIAMKLYLAILQEGEEVDYGIAPGTWDDKMLQNVAELKRIAYGQQPAAEPSPQPPAAPAGTSPIVGNLKAAIAAHEQIVDASEGRSAKWKKDFKNRIRLALAPLDQNMLLANLGHDVIVRLVDRLISRRKKNTLAGKSVRAYLGSARSFLNWLDATDQFNWQAPRGMARTLKVSASLTGSSRDPRHMTVDQLKTLYAAADNRTKLAMLLGLNCGWIMGDITSATPDMFHLGGKHPHVARQRHKTKAAGHDPKPGQWALWAETVELLKTARRFESVNALTLAWKRLRAKCGLLGDRSTAFKALRATAGQFIRDAAGHELAEAFLSHREKGVAAAYHKFGRQDLLNKAVLRVRSEMLAPMFHGT